MYVLCSVCQCTTNTTLASLIRRDSLINTFDIDTICLGLTKSETSCDRQIKQNAYSSFDATSMIENKCSLGPRIVTLYGPSDIYKRKVFPY